MKALFCLDDQWKPGELQAGGPPKPQGVKAHESGDWLSPASARPMPFPIRPAPVPRLASLSSPRVTSPCVPAPRFGNRSACLPACGRPIAMPTASPCARSSCGPAGDTRQGGWPATQPRRLPRARPSSRACRPHTHVAPQGIADRETKGSLAKRAQSETPSKTARFPSSPALGARPGSCRLGIRYRNFLAAPPNSGPSSLSAALALPSQSSACCWLTGSHRPLTAPDGSEARASSTANRSG